MKTKLFVSAIALAAITVFSCNKQEAAPPETAHNGSANASTMNGLAWGLNNWYIDFIQDCIHVPVDCFDEIIVTPGKFNKLQLAINGGPSEIAKFFNDQANYAGILPASPVADSLAAELSTGSYDLSVYSISTTKKKIFIGTTSPVDTSNYTSVMQVSVK